MMIGLCRLEIAKKYFKFGEYTPYIFHGVDEHGI